MSIFLRYLISKSAGKVLAYETWGSEKLFLRLFCFSKFLTETLIVNNIAMKSFSELLKLSIQALKSP